MGAGWSPALLSSLWAMKHVPCAVKWHLWQFGKRFTLRPASWLIDINSMPCPGHMRKCKNDVCLWATVTWRSWSDVSSNSCLAGDMPASGGVEKVDSLEQWPGVPTLLHSLKYRCEDFEEEL